MTKLAIPKLYNCNESMKKVIHIKHESGSAAWKMIERNESNKLHLNSGSIRENVSYTCENAKLLEQYLSYPMTKKDWVEFGDYHNMNINPITLWDKLLNKINKILVQALAQKKITFKHVSGHKVNIPRYLKGHPKNMYKRKDGEKHSDIINVFVINSSYNSFEPQYRIHIQAIISAILSGLEIYGGYKLNLSAGRIARNYNSISLHEIQLKKPGEKLSLQQHGFVLMATAIQRILGWGTEENFCTYDHLEDVVPSYQYKTIDSEGIVALKDSKSLWLKAVKEAGCFKDNTLIFNLNDFVLRNLSTETLFADKAEENFIIETMNKFIKAIEGDKNE